MDNIITVFTPAYNRAHTLHLCYESLLRQDNKSFEWLIVDDGSSDNTAELVKSWQSNDNGFDIRYIYKENGGMHSAHNVAYKNIKTELNVCIDSDDYLADDAIQMIISRWQSLDEDKTKYAGIIGLDATFDNLLIGKKLPDDMESTTLAGYYENGGVGDKKLVYRTDLICEISEYPEIEGEKYFPLAYKYFILDKDYELLILNEILCNVEYMEDGSSRNMFRQYLRNPLGFAMYRCTAIKAYRKPFYRLKEAIHFNAERLIAKKSALKLDSHPIMEILTFVPGWLLYLYILYNKNKMMRIRSAK